MDSAGVKVLETAEDIQERRQQVLDRYRRFKELSIMRRQKLEDSYRFQFFRRDADELEKWIQEKLQIASDENYKDPSNLQVRPPALYIFPFKPLPPFKALSSYFIWIFISVKVSVITLHDLWQLRDGISYVNYTG